MGKQTSSSETVTKVGINRKLDWKTFFSILIPGALTVLGWFILNTKASKRDADNKLRDVRLSYLIEDYRKLANAAMRNPYDVQYLKDIEFAISDIQLLGSKEQIASLNYMLDNPDDLGHGMKGMKFDALLNDFRTSLRKELKLEPIEGNIRWQRLGSGNYTKEQLDSIYAAILKEQNKTLDKKGN